MAKDDGGCAFPVALSATETTKLGMTLRDYFAAAAMQGILASYAPCDNLSFKLVASMAYQQADAMLAERAK